MSLISYFTIRFIVAILRSLLRPATLFAPRVPPSRTIDVPSTKDKSRSIRCNIHEPTNIDPGVPLPVHINIHGGGFTLSTLGMDSVLFSGWAKRVGCIVVDADYSKGPERPFPAAGDDILDIVAYIQSQPTVFDASRMTIGGFSAGGNLALGAALQLPNVFKAVIAWYPSCDFSRPLKSFKKMARSDPGFELYKPMTTLFRLSYVPEGTDLKDPRLSPTYGALETLPPLVFITCECDRLAAEGVLMVEKIRTAGVDVQHLMVANAGHAWERNVKKGTPQYAAKIEASEITIRRLEEAYA